MNVKPFGHLGQISPKYLAELRGPNAISQQPENAYGESERLGLGLNVPPNVDT